MDQVMEYYGIYCHDEGNRGWLCSKDSGEVIYYPDEKIAYAHLINLMRSYPDLYMSHLVKTFGRGRNECLYDEYLEVYRECIETMKKHDSGIDNVSND